MHRHRYHTAVRRIATHSVARPATMARSARPARLALALLLAAAGCETQQTASLDDAVRAFDAKRYAESLRIAKEVQSGSPEQGVRQQAAYVAGRSASELNKRDEARDVVDAGDVVDEHAQAMVFERGQRGVGEPVVGDGRSARVGQRADVNVEAHAGDVRERLRAIEEHNGQTNRRLDRLEAGK